MDLFIIYSFLESQYSLIQVIKRTGYDQVKNSSEVMSKWEGPQLFKFLRENVAAWCSLGT